MNMSTEKLAKVISASLNIKDRGILTFHIDVTYEDGLCQSVGGIVLDTYNKTSKEREGTAGGCELIRRLLLMMNVNDFSEMSGKYLWVIGEGEGLGFSPIGIRALNVDKIKNGVVIFKEPFDL